MNNDEGFKVTSRTILTVKSHINSQIYYHYEIEIAYSRNVKLCRKTKLEVLNPNSLSRISCQDLQNEAVH